MDNFNREHFLPTTKQDMKQRGWEDYDFLVITGDAYVDHPSFGSAVISRVLEDEGYKVAIMAQPNWKQNSAFTALGRPKYGVFLSGGNVDPMVAHYTVAKKRRNEDAYSPGKVMGLRPDRATLVYANKVREVYPDMPIIIGGLEASLRRFAHYDYWEDKVRRGMLMDCGADLLVYGMGERATRDIAARLVSGTKPSDIQDVKGTCYITNNIGDCTYPKVEVPSYEEVVTSKKAYAAANLVEYDEHDPVRGRAIIQKHGTQYLVTNPPAMPLNTKELDHVAELPYVREPHPDYDDKGGVSAIEEVRFSVIHNRGCFGACHFCSLAFHQGRMITSRSHESVIREVTALTKHLGFKGYIHDVGGPTANFRHMSCTKQEKHGLCKNRDCLAPTPCPNLNTDHSDYLMLLRKLRAISGIKKIFIRSGIRFDYLMADKGGEFFTDLVQHHISGQLKVAPEHCVGQVLDAMGKPNISVYEKFQQKYQKLNQRYGKEQYLVPYLMSSHPGCSLESGVELAQWLSRSGRQPEQVQDFYPTPGTLSTCMYYTGLNPRTMEPIYVPKDPHEKAMQRALMQWKRPEKRRLVQEALKLTHREDLVGFGKEHLIRPDRGAQGWEKKETDATTKGKSTANKGKTSVKKGNYTPTKDNKPTEKPAKRKAGWAAPKAKKNVKPRSKAYKGGK